MFAAARIRLTIFYVAVIAMILIVFSVVLYASVAKNLRSELDDNSVSEHEMQRYMRTTDHLQMNLIVSDLIVLLVASGLSYLLAGKTLKPIQHALDAQKRFTADASHELRTPLTIVKTEHEVLLQNSRAQIVDYQKNARSALEEVNRMSTIVENLLALSRGDQSQMSLQKSPVELRDVVRAVSEKMQRVAETHGLIVHLGNMEAGKILGIASSLEHLVTNLLQNAIQYTSAGGSIEVNVVQKRSVMELTVQDTGIGIADEHMPHIFDRFYKVDSARTHHAGGAGLGLSIVKAVVELHGGRIRIDSILHKGSLLTVELPRMHEKT